MTVWAETSFQNRYAQSLQPDTTLSVKWFPIVSFSQPALQDDWSPVQIAAPALQWECWQSLDYFFCHYLLRHQTITVCVFFHRFSLCSLNESTLLLIVKQNTTVVFEYTINRTTYKLQLISIIWYYLNFSVLIDRSHKLLKTYWMYITSYNIPLWCKARARRNHLRHCTTQFTPQLCSVWKWLTKTKHVAYDKVSIMLCLNRLVFI